MLSEERLELAKFWVREHVMPSTVAETILASLEATRWRLPSEAEEGSEHWVLATPQLFGNIPTYKVVPNTDIVIITEGEVASLGDDQIVSWLPLPTWRGAQ